MKRKKPNPYETPKPRYVPSEKYKKPPFTTLKPRPSKLVYTEAELNVLSLPSSSADFIHPSLHSARFHYEGEMAEREAAAVTEQKRRAKMLVPLYSKGPVQFIGNNPPREILEGLGRKL